MKYIFEFEELSYSFLWIKSGIQVKVEIKKNIF